MSKPFLKNILAAVNGSQSSMQAVMYGIIMAKQYNLNLKIVYVVDTATVKFLASSNFFVDEEKDYYLESLRKDGKTYLNYAENLAKIISMGTPYKTAVPEGIASYGGYKDWVISKLGIPAFTRECGKGENPLPPSDFDNIYKKVLPILLTAAAFG